MNPTPLPVPPT